MKDIIIRATVNDEVYETVTDLLDKFENMSDNVIDFYEVEDDKTYCYEDKNYKLTKVQKNFLINKLLQIDNKNDGDNYDTELKNIVSDLRCFFQLPRFDIK